MVKNLYFKVKKVNIEGNDYIGVVLPYYNQSGYGFVSKLTISNEVCILKTFKGEEIKFNIKCADIKSTRITNNEVKEIMEYVIKCGKENHAKFKKIMTLSHDINIKLDGIEKNKVKIDKKMKEVVSKLGYINKEEFYKKMESCEIPYGYNLDFTILNGCIENIQFEKEHNLGIWINDGDYTFLYEEYDGNIMVCDNYEENKELRQIKKKYFKRLSCEKINGYNIKEDFYPCGGGDKRSASIIHGIDINLKNGIELKEANIKNVKAIISSFVKSLV